MTKTPHNAPITSFEFEPVSDGAMAEHHPGQYPGVWLKPEDLPYQEIRQYSPTHKPNGKDYRIAAKREDGGQVPAWLHNHANTGDVVHPVALVGDFFTDVTTDTPISLTSAGVGQTLILVMLDTLARAQHTMQINWLHAAENDGVHAFADEVNELGRTLSHSNAHTWYCGPTEAGHAKDISDSVGLMDLNKLESTISDPAAQSHLCGPVGFTQFAARQLVGLGAKSGSVYYECFGPHKVL